MTKHYILDGRKVIATDFLTWARWFEKNDRKVARERVGTNIEVSTVFLGLDHSFGGTEPMIFETMVFGGPIDGEMTRCSTWEQAEVMHKEMVAKAKEAL
jgi:hypothetical protein